MGEPVELADFGVLGPDYTEDDASALEAEALPKYLSFFGELAADRLVLTPQAAVVVVGTLASSVVDPVAARLPGATFRVYEASDALACVVVERTTHVTENLEVASLLRLPIPQPDESFTHAIALHPLTPPRGRLALFRELARVLVPGGQALVAMPLRGSFPELVDMLREHATKHDLASVTEAIELAAQSRPTPETLVEELEVAGLGDVEVDVELLSVPFETGRDFEQHPVLRLVLAPDLRLHLGLPDQAAHEAIAYSASAIGKYWSDGPFDLSVNLACALGRKPG